MKHMPNHVARRGFTLLEILVTVALFSLLVLMLFSIVQSSTVLWRESERRVDSYREARAAINVMSSDLRAAVTNLGNPEATTSIPTLCANIEAGSTFVSNMPGDRKGGNLFFHTRLASNSQNAEQNQSNLCQVGYYLAFTNDGATSGTGAFGSYKLFRYLMSSQPTFQRLSAFMGGTGLLFDIGAQEAISEPLAFAINDFQTRVFTINTDATLTESNDNDFQEKVFVEIEITALNNDVARRLATKAEWDDAPNDQGDYIQNSRSFITNIQVPQGLIAEP